VPGLDLVHGAGVEASAPRWFLPLQMGVGDSPSGPFKCGSTTWSVSPVAAAASNALPPFSKTPIATALASQWVEATTPNVP